MTDEYSVSLREAMQILGKKAATVRAYIRSGRLSKQYVEGFNGQEIRLKRSELDELKKSIKDTTHITTRRVSNTVKDKGNNSPSTTITVDSLDNSHVAQAINVLERELEELRKEKEQLRQEGKELGEKNFQMAGQLGYFQNQVEMLKDQVKQLSAPSSDTKKSSKSNFWSRLGFSRR